MMPWCLWQQSTSAQSHRAWENSFVVANSKWPSPTWTIRAYLLFLAEQCRRQWMMTLHALLATRIFSVWNCYMFDTFLCVLWKIKLYHLMMQDLFLVRLKYIEFIIGIDSCIVESRYSALGLTLALLSPDTRHWDWLCIVESGYW